MNKNWIYISGGILIILIASAVQFFSPRPATAPTSPTASSSPSVWNSVSNATSSAPAVAPETVDSSTAGLSTQHPLPLVNGDHIASWDFKGAYADNPELMAKAQAEITRLLDLLATATSSAMIISVGITNQYELLGDGKKQYEYLGRAIRTNPENGLPWHNLGVLMERLGALETARVAYEKSTLVQPEMKFYHYAYIEFLMTRMKDKTSYIGKGFAFAEKNIGQTPYLLELRAEWQQP